jgi:hypothetical protein
MFSFLPAPKSKKRSSDDCSGTESVCARKGRRTRRWRGWVVFVLSLQLFLYGKVYGRKRIGLDDNRSPDSSGAGYFMDFGIEWRDCSRDAWHGLKRLSAGLYF